MVILLKNYFENLKAKYNRYQTRGLDDIFGNTDLYNNLLRLKIVKKWPEIKSALIFKAVVYGGAHTQSSYIYYKTFLLLRVRYHIQVVYIPPIDKNLPKSPKLLPVNVRAVSP